MMRSRISISPDQYLVIVASIFITLLVLSEILLNRCFLWAGFLVSGRDLVYPLTFFLVNVVSKEYGARVARVLIIHGFFTSLITTTLLWIVWWLPTAGSSPIAEGDFGNSLGRSIYVSLGLLAAYLVGQLSNLYLFSKLYGWLCYRYSLLASALASVLAQCVDVALLVMIWWLFQLFLDGLTCPFSLLGTCMFRVTVLLLGVIGTVMQRVGQSRG